MVTSKALTWDAKKEKHKQSGELKKHEYEDQHRTTGILHYTGSKAAVVWGPHGNSKSGEPYIITSPVVAQRIAALGLTQKPGAILAEERGHMLPGTLSATESARNATKSNPYKNNFVTRY